MALASAARHPRRVERLVVASSLARFAAEQAAAMEAGMEAKAGEPWYEDARAALEVEQAGEWQTDEKLICGPDCAREIAAGIAGATLVLLPDCGHVVFVEQPQRFAAEVSAFLSSPSAVPVVS